MNKTGFILGCGALALLAASPAWASAWTQKKGETQVFLTGVYSNSDKGFDANGNVVEIDDYQKNEVYLLIEHGISDDLTVIANPSYRHVGIEGRDDDTSGLGYTELGARYRLGHGDRWVASVQGSIRIPGERRRDSLAQVGSTDTEYDLRGLVGGSFKLGAMDGFFDIQGGYRLRDGDAPNEWRGDVTLGIRPASKVQVIGQVFNTWSDGRGRGIFPSYRYHNAQLNLVYDVSDRVSLQLGGLATLGGRNALRERGATAGVWLRF